MRALPNEGINENRGELQRGVVKMFEFFNVGWGEIYSRASWLPQYILLQIPRSASEFRFNSNALHQLVWCRKKRDTNGNNFCFRK